MAFTNDTCVIFYHCGKTMIGRFYKEVPSEISGKDTVHETLGTTSDVYYVKKPAEIVFELNVPASGSAQLKWEIKPIFYDDLVNSDSELYATFPKDSVVLTNLAGDKINNLITTAYSDICS